MSECSAINTRTRNAGVFAVSTHRLFMVMAYVCWELIRLFVRAISCIASVDCWCIDESDRDVIDVVKIINKRRSYYGSLKIILLFSFLGLSMPLSLYKELFKLEKILFPYSFLCYLLLIG